VAVHDERDARGLHPVQERRVRHGSSPAGGSGAAAPRRPPITLAGRSDA
jgi:hypothetical protein